MQKIKISLFAACLAHAHGMDDTLGTSAISQNGIALRNQEVQKKAFQNNDLFSLLPKELITLILKHSKNSHSTLFPKDQGYLSNTSFGGHDTTLSVINKRFKIIIDEVCEYLKCKVNPLEIDEHNLRSFLSGFHNIQRLIVHPDLRKNFFTNVGLSKEIDISFISKFKRLTQLDLKSLQITDVSSLGELTNLISLGLDHCPVIKDLSAVSKLTKLEKMNLSWCDETTDLSKLSTLVNLKKLKLGHRDVSMPNLSFINSLDNLKKLRIIANFVFMQRLESLRSAKKIKYLKFEHFDELVSESPELRFVFCKHEGRSVLDSARRLAVFWIRRGEHPPIDRWFLLKLMIGLDPLDKNEEV